MNQKQKLKELHERLKKWKENLRVPLDKSEAEELDKVITELESFDPGGDDEDGSNPPKGPGTPP